MTRFSLFQIKVNTTVKTMPSHSEKQIMSSRPLLSIQQTSYSSLELSEDKTKNKNAPNKVQHNKLGTINGLS